MSTLVAVALFATSQLGIADRPTRIALRAIVFVGLITAYALIVSARERRLKQMLEELEERRERFAAIFENSGEMMALYELDGRIVQVNHAAFARLGFGADIASRHYEVHIAAEERSTVSRAFAQAAAGQASEFATVFLDVRGKRVPVVANLSPISVRGRVVGVVGAARDVTAEQQYEEQLLRNRERFRGLFEQNSYAMVAIKPDGTLSAVNVAMERLCGFSNEEVVGKPALMLTPPARRELAERRLVELTETERAMSYESVLLCRGDHELPVEVDVIPIRVSGKLDGFYMTIKDLTRERALSDRLAERDGRVSALYRVASSASNAALQLDEALALGAKALSMQYGFVTRVENGVFTIAHRYGPDDGLMPVGFRLPYTRAIGLRMEQSPRALAIDDLTLGEDGAELRERDIPWKSCIGSRILLQGESYGSLLFLDKQTRAHPFEKADVDFIDLMSSLAAGAIVREGEERKLQEHSQRDALTGLANRSRLEQAINRAIARARRSQDGFAVHFVDLDRFKPVNDAYGHAEGDRVLQEIAKRLAATIRSGDLAARVGGDEFVVLQTQIEASDSTRDLRDRIVGALAQPLQGPDGKELSVGCSIGVAVFPADGKDAAELLRCADAAMYRDKQRKRGSIAT